MTHWLSKKEMTEEDIKLQFITPAIQQKWGLDCITMETKVQLTDGRISLKGNIAFREAPKKADYVLYQCANNPIAVVEAKDNSHSMIKYYRKPKVSQSIYGINDLSHQQCVSVPQEVGEEIIVRVGRLTTILGYRFLSPRLSQPIYKRKTNSRKNVRIFSHKSANDVCDSV